jgi:hypothetical protein
MIAFELDRRLSGRAIAPRSAVRLLQILARLKKPQRVPHDFREIERVRLEHERRKAHAAMISRFKVM